MRNLLFIIILLFSLAACVQTKKALSTADDMLDRKSGIYNPPKAFDIYLQYAQKGNAQAMNSVGVLYQKGLGTPVNDQESFKWLTKATQMGNADAWFNLSRMYAMGRATSQNYATAIACLKKGIAMGDGTAYYGLGYMYYKGIGVKQSYETAVKLFRKAATTDDLGSRYMLGLCFKNGYGVETNNDSAHYWIKDAAQNNYAYAKDELKIAFPENADLKLPGFSYNPGDTLIYPTLKDSTRYLPGGDIAGEYIGTITRFDYSGKFIIKQSNLKLTLSTNGTLLSGAWTEDDTIKTTIKGNILDSAFILKNTSYRYPCHYDTKNEGMRLYQFKNTGLKIVKNAEAVILKGNLNLYLEVQEEPEKPVFVMLTRKTANPPK